MKSTWPQRLCPQLPPSLFTISLRPHLISKRTSTLITYSPPPTSSLLKLHPWRTPSHQTPHSRRIHFSPRISSCQRQLSHHHSIMTKQAMLSSRCSVKMLWLRITCLINLRRTTTIRVWELVFMPHLRSVQILALLLATLELMITAST